ncbi:hypothetical protein GCM10009838_51800 [Catenulispora subtropica]|uniref:Uncharacterized protein n=1 Tax=Catenulispora subtropica TaxID=450798 RepID=A0ABP5DS56_9ACTN
MATEPFQDRLATETLFPDCVQVPFHPLCSVWFPAYEYVRFQLVHAGPLFVMTTCAPNPLPESQVVEYTAVHPGVDAAFELVAVSAANPPATAMVNPDATKALVKRRAGRSVS